MTAVACKDCAAPIAQPAGGGHPRMFCAACIARRQRQYQREYRASRTPEQREARNQYHSEWRAGRASPEQRAARSRHSAKYRARRTPEDIAAEVWAQRERMLQKKYGMSIADFDAKLAAQGGRCAICGTDAPNGKGWHVDHDHKSGAVRGILCSGCNPGLGHFNDDPAILRGAIAYLESHAMEVTP